MNQKFKVWDSENNCWYKPKYNIEKQNVEELLMTMSGELCMHISKNGVPRMIHELSFPERFKVCQYTGHKDNEERKWFDRDIVKKGDAIGVLIILDCQLLIASGDPKNWNALDVTNKKELSQCTNVGNLYETPDYWTLLDINRK